MNEFNKKYLQIAKSYNFKIDKLINENTDNTVNFIKTKASNTKNWINNILNIIKNGADSLLSLVTRLV